MSVQDASESTVQTTAPDEEVAAALRLYIERALPMQAGSIAVDYVGGTVSLSGAVASERVARAIEDLVRWHDRVSNVRNNLQVTMTPAPARAPR
jgi:osmotically-inducible protein OsmY